MTQNEEIIDEPYFSKADISFINYPFVSAEEKFVRAEPIKKYITDLKDRFTGYVMRQNEQGQLSVFIVDRIPESFANLFITDAVKANILLSNIVTDYFPKEVIMGFDAENFSEEVKQNMIYELNRYNDWVVSKGGRHILAEIDHRFGITK